MKNVYKCFGKQTAKVRWEDVLRVYRFFLAQGNNPLIQQLLEVLAHSKASKL